MILSFTITIGTEYLRKNGERFFRPAYEELESGRAANAENERIAAPLR